MTEEFTGTALDRASNLRDHQGNWCVQTFRGQLVGYWEFYVLERKNFDKVRNGRMLDGEINNSMLVPLWTPGRYNMYFNVITTEEGDHRKEGPVLNMVGAIGSRLSNLANRGIFFNNICADAFTTRGKKLCKLMGLKPILKNPKAPNGFDAIIYSMGGKDIRNGLLGENEALVDAYSNEFKFDH